MNPMNPINITDITFENIVPEMKNLRIQIEALHDDIGLDSTCGKDRAIIFKKMLKLQTRLNNY